jgi:phosphatidylserine decarboxylase
MRFFLVLNLLFLVFVSSGFSSKRTEDNPIKLQPVILDIKKMIEEDPLVRMYFTQMIAQAPKDSKNLKSIEDLLYKLNKLLKTAPEFSLKHYVVCPLTKILVSTMGTPAGLAGYRNEKINMIIKRVLFEWAKFLNSADSLYVINDSENGWKCAKAQEILKMDDYKYDPKKKYWGFKSWNDFFARKLVRGARPIADQNNNKVIVSACDSTVYKISKNVKKYDDFWIKSQPYSLSDMLGSDMLADKFVGGDVYQAFLKPFNYHRWSSPIAGTIKRAFVKEGLYFSKNYAERFSNTAQINSQGYIAHLQTRAIILIESDDPKIGLVCFMPIGMVEISSCIINDDIKPGYHVKKGEDLGCFNYGGSTHCLIFRPGVIKNFTAKSDNFYKTGEQIAIAN